MHTYRVTCYAADGSPKYHECSARHHKAAARLGVAAIGHECEDEWTLVRVCRLPLALGCVKAYRASEVGGPPTGARESAPKRLPPGLGRAYRLADRAEVSRREVKRAYDDYRCDGLAHAEAVAEVNAWLAYECQVQRELAAS